MRGSIVDPKKSKGRRKTWGVVISLGRDSQTGKLKQQWKGGFKKRADAVAYLNEVLPLAQNGTWTPPSKERFTAFAQRWLKDYAAATVRPTTLASYHMICRKHLIPELGLMPLTQLRPDRIQQYFTKKLESGLSSTTVRHHAMLLHRILATAVREGLLIQNPTDRVDVPRNRAVEMQTFDTERARLFLAAARSSPLYRLFLFAVLTGCRLGECLGLAWTHCNLTLGFAEIVQTLYWLYGSKAKGERTQLLLKEPKSKQAKGAVPLPPPLPEELRRLRDEQEENRRLLGERYHDYGLIFTQVTGRPLHPSDVRKEFHRVLREAQLPKIRFHDLRHSHASLRLEQGDHPKLLQAALRHSTAAFTLQTYSHLQRGMLEESAQRLATRLLGSVEADEQ